jgi:hypothetical protein
MGSRKPRTFPRFIGQVQFFRFVATVILVLSFFSLSFAGPLHIAVKANKLTVHAEKVPLQTILKRISRLGIRVRIDPGVNPLVSASFRDQDLQKGLESVLKSVNRTFIWDTVEGPLGPEEKLVEIQVFRPGRKGLIRPLRGRSSLEIAKNPADGSFYVERELFVRLAPGVDPAEFQELLRALGATMLDAVPEIGLYRIVLPEGADVPSIVEQIQNDPSVQKAEPNYAYPIAAPQEYPAEGVTASRRKTSQGVGDTPIAVLDTGLSMTSGLEELVLASVDAMNRGEPITDPLGHGTQMALIASGVVQPEGSVPGSSTTNPIIPVNIFDENGYTSNFHIMRGVQFALENKARVMSLSWGTQTQSEFLEDTLSYASSEGLLLVASAGNEPTGKAVYPAAFSFVIGVGALKPDGSVWENSNRGHFVVIWAPGTASLPVGYKGAPGRYAGTSISAAYAANVIAGYLSKNPDASIQEVLQGVSRGIR